MPTPNVPELQDGLHRDLHGAGQLGVLRALCGLGGIAAAREGGVRNGPGFGVVLAWSKPTNQAIKVSKQPQPEVLAGDSLQSTLNLMSQEGHVRSVK